MIPSHHPTQSPLTPPTASTPLATARADTPGTTGGSSSASAPPSNLAQQRQALHDQVDALRQAGALPPASTVGQPGSAVSWNNWSNG